MSSSESKEVEEAPIIASMSLEVALAHETLEGRNQNGKPRDTNVGKKKAKGKFQILQPFM